MMEKRTVETTDSLVSVFFIELLRAVRNYNMYRVSNSVFIIIINGFSVITKS